MPQNLTIVGLGEALFDIFPQRQMLGGAPLNVAVHAWQLLAGVQTVGGRERRGRGVVVSRVGQDDLGRQILDELRGHGMATDYVQTDPDKATGKVYVDPTGGEDGGPSYDIVGDVAWDWLQFDPDLESLARQCQAVAFGSLAQRGAQSRNAILRFVETARQAIRLFDVNLRQSFYDLRTITRSCEHATVVKLNAGELETLAELLNLSHSDEDDQEALIELRARALLKRFKLKLVAVTRGQAGTMLVTPDTVIRGEAVIYPSVENADAVGAGDACSAGLLVGLLSRWPLPRVVELANHMGAYVASQPGATPKLPEEILAMVARG